jgi:hypothetical protein
MPADGLAHDVKNSNGLLITRFLHSRLLLGAPFPTIGAFALSQEKNHALCSKLTATSPLCEAGRPCSGLRRTAGSDDTHAPKPKQLKRSKPMKQSKSPRNDKVGGARMTSK